jgi:hypothetical protein
MQRFIQVQREEASQAAQAKLEEAVRTAEGLPVQKAGDKMLTTTTRFFGLREGRAYDGMPYLRAAFRRPRNRAHWRTQQ